MELMPTKVPDERVISAIDPDPACSLGAEKETDSRFELKGSQVFFGNGRAIFIGMLTGALLISAAGFAYVKREREKRRMLEVPRLFTAATHKTIVSPTTNTAPAPMVVNISDCIHVSAIALGHPRLAVINRHLVAEGGWITVHTPTRAVAVTLRVLKIADGVIDLTDGTQIIRAQLEIMTPTPREQK
jgi:hypothetical protein